MVRRSPSPDYPPTGRDVGIRHPRAVGAGVWVWGPNTVSLACMSCGAACRGAGGVPSPLGVACHRCEERLVSGAVPPPAASPLGRAAGVPRPVCPGCGWCRRGDPAPAPQHAPLRAGVARCGGGGRASPGGLPSTVVRGVCGQALPPPDCPPTGRAVGVRHPVGVGANECVSVPNTVPLACMPCGGCVPWGWGGGVPGAGGLRPL